MFKQSFIIELVWHRNFYSHFLREWSLLSSPQLCFWIVIFALIVARHSIICCPQLLAYLWFSKYWNLALIITYSRMKGVFYIALIFQSLRAIQHFSLYFKICWNSIPTYAIHSADCFQTGLDLFKNGQSHFWHCVADSILFVRKILT